MYVSSDNQLKRQITKWQKEGRLPPKHIKGLDYEFMIQKREQRKAKSQKNTTFLYRGWEVPPERIDRYKERYHIGDSPLASRPVGKSIYGRSILRVYAKRLYRDTYLHQLSHSITRGRRPDSL